MLRLDDLCEVADNFWDEITDNVRAEEAGTSNVSSEADASLDVSVAVP